MENISWKGWAIGGVALAGVGTLTYLYVNQDDTPDTPEGKRDAKCKKEVHSYLSQHPWMYILGPLAIGAGMAAGTSACEDTVDKKEHDKSVEKKKAAEFAKKPDSYFYDLWDERVKNLFNNYATATYDLRLYMLKHASNTDEENKYMDVKRLVKLRATYLAKFNADVEGKVDAIGKHIEAATTGWIKGDEAALETLYTKTPETTYVWTSPQMIARLSQIQDAVHNRTSSPEVDTLLSTFRDQLWTKLTEDIKSLTGSDTQFTPEIQFFVNKIARQRLGTRKAVHDQLWATERAWHAQKVKELAKDLPMGGGPTEKDKSNKCTGLRQAFGSLLDDPSEDNANAQLKKLFSDGTRWQPDMTNDFMRMYKAVKNITSESTWKAQRAKILPASKKFIYDQIYGAYVKPWACA